MIGEQPTSRTKIQVIKVRGGSSLKAVVCCEEPLTFFVHWLGTRSFMCPGVDCAACFAGVGAKWLGLLGVRYEIPHAERAPFGVLELTSAAYERLLGLARLEGEAQLYKMVVEFSRRSKRSSLAAEPCEIPSLQAVVKRPVPEWYLLDGAATLYGLPSCREGMSLADWQAAAIPRSAQLIRAALPAAVRRDSQ